MLNGKQIEAVELSMKKNRPMIPGGMGLYTRAKPRRVKGWFAYPQFDPMKGLLWIRRQKKRQLAMAGGELDDPLYRPKLYPAPE
jgi:hypothetical protein